MAAVLGHPPLIGIAQNARFLSCSVISNDGERLSCYDMTAKWVKENESQAIRAVTHNYSHEELVAAFGLRQSDQTVKVDEDYALDELEVFITSVETTPNRTQLITLSNGQTWLENTQGRTKINSDQKAVIKRESFSYKIVPENGRTLKVHRVK